MNNIKTIFTSTDMENISGIKAHTIRIWEKRYQLFTPNRVSRNIRHYNLENLQKLLNVALLNKQGMKISKIAELTELEIITKVKSLASCDIELENACNEIKIAMYQFDAAQFEDTYKHALQQYSFSEVYQKVFTPFLHFLGMLWQTTSITPAHEHFISNLIYQKIQVNIEQIKVIPHHKRTFILYLPEEEMHEISLLYLNYELISRGYQTIYLGRSIPFQNLAQFKSLFPLLCWVSIFTIAPSSKSILTYLQDIEELVTDSPHHFWMVGQSLPAIINNPDSSNIKIFPSLKKVLSSIKKESSL